MGLPPDRMDTLRDIARALGPAPAPVPPPSGRPPGAWTVALLAAGALVLGWTAVRTCGFRGCAEVPEVAVRVARVVETTAPRAPPAASPNGAVAPPERVRAAAPPEAVATAAVAAPATPAAAATSHPAARTAVPDLSGAWLVTNTIHETTRGAFRGMRIGFRVWLRQDGRRVIGVGRKLTVDGRPVARGERTPIALDGSIQGDEVVARFVEKGHRRTTRGTFRWRLSPDGARLVGSFESTAAASRGPSSARRDD